MGLGRIYRRRRGKFRRRRRERQLGRLIWVAYAAADEKSGARHAIRRSSSGLQSALTVPLEPLAPDLTQRVSLRDRRGRPGCGGSQVNSLRTLTKSSREDHSEKLAAPTGARQMKEATISHGGSTVLSRPSIISPRIKASIAKITFVLRSNGQARSGSAKGSA